MSAATVESARLLLKELGFDAERRNQRAALVLLALAGLKPGDAWDAATNEALGVTPIMERVREWGVHWKPNTRETVRRRALHQFRDAALIEQNHDDPERAVNSSLNNYRLTRAALDVVRAWESSDGSRILGSYLAAQPGQAAAYAAARELARIPVTLPSGDLITLSPGGQNVLLQAIVEDFAPRFTPGGRVLYIGDADGRATFDSDALGSLGVVIPPHSQMPDLIVHDVARGWLVLCEAASTHGPVDGQRHGELKRLFGASSAGLVFVSCFPDRAIMRGWLPELAWETEAWCADAPDHLIHLNGSRFLGPY